MSDQQIPPASPASSAPSGSVPRLPTGWNAGYLEAMYARWVEHPQSLDAHWRHFFEGFALGISPHLSLDAQQAAAQSRVASLIFAYRNQGHLMAHLDPLSDPPPPHPDLALDRFGFTEADLDRMFDTGHLCCPQQLTLGGILEVLRATYCGTIGVEYLHIQDVHIRRWIQQQIEPIRNRSPYDRARKRAILEQLVNAELFETFTHSRYPGQKRFSLEGAESLIPALHFGIELAAQLGAEELVLGMAHRGRLNVLANILRKSYEMIFSEFEDISLPEAVGGDGDVKYHKGYSSNLITGGGLPVHVTLTANPSHLEAADAVVLGRARAKQRQRDDLEHRRKVIPLLIHGDAAFVGQGVVAETLNLSRLKGYRTGGTIHIIINNQIGFTTLPHELRSSLYVTDVAKMIEAPIFHVNGDDPEAVVHVTELAFRYRREFGKDAVVDIVCYRRHGHNESDEPAFTQPVLYRKIQQRPSVRRLYTRHLTESGDLPAAEVEAIARDFQNRLEAAFEFDRKPHAAIVMPQAFESQWRGLLEPYSDAPAATGIEAAPLEEVAEGLCRVPEGFALNPKVARQLPERLEAIRRRGTVDWAFAEALAIGSLLAQGTPVRLTGQDSARGTFSQRHAVWQDMNTQESYTPADHIRPGQAKFCVYNSPLSEASVLGFEYGYSLSEPRMLILWEAQFGDFANGAQVIVDQFLVSSQAKWGRTSGLVMLLPHGYEGQGPEHSNAYLERYLAACAENNIQVCNLTTPANYFHMLRRQVSRPFRRPLILMAPKSLLRHKRAVSPVEDLIEGAFQEFLDDPAPPRNVRRLVLCSGKVFYDLLEARESGGPSDVALVRVEQFYPFHERVLLRILDRYQYAEEVVWCQEEPQNRGGWTFMAPRLQALFPNHHIHYIGRPASASPATGSPRIHKMEQSYLIKETLEGHAMGRKHFPSAPSTSDVFALADEIPAVGAS